MADQTVLSAQKRELTGKKVARLRYQGSIPASISTGKKTQVISLQKKEFSDVYDKVGESGLIYVQIEGVSQKIPVLIEEIQLSPVKNWIEHVMFKKVSLKEKVEADVTIEFIGENEVNDAVVNQVADTVTVEALPTDLPDKLEVDIAQLTEIGQSVTFADLVLPSGVTLAMDEDQASQPVVLLQEVKEEIEPEEETEAETAEAEQAAESQDEGQETTE